MKNTLCKRVVSFLLCVVMVLGLLPALGINTVHAATTSQNNIVARADYMYDITWVPKSTVYGWNYNYTFYAGSTYRIPYGQPINSGAYIGFGVSVDDFLAAANTAGSVFYTSRSTYDSTSSVYYANDCSAFVSWCWGTSRKTTYSIPQVSTYIGMATAANAYSLQLGDCLNSNDVGHVVLVTDLVYSGSTLTSIEITEQTPPQLKRSYYTPTELGNKYGAYYGIYRYTGTVPAAPNGYTNDDSGSSSSGSANLTGKYYPACDSSYESLIPAMASIGVTLDWELQCEIAELNGISDFSGTAEQNTTLLNLLKAGKLLNPNYVPVSYYPACASSCTTFYEGMADIGVDCDWELHSEIAAANGITNFSGTAEQNETLLSLLKAGKLIIPGSGSSDDSSSSGSGSGSSSSGTVTSGSNGYERGYEGGMAGTGEYKAFGLDVSSYQGSNLNFQRIKNAGYDYVILRAGTTKTMDECFETYYTNAKAAGLDVGAYYYSYALDTATAASDAQRMLSVLEGKTFEYPIYFDYEDSTQQSLNSSNPTLSKNICLTFMDAIAEEGYLVGMYTGKYFSTQLPLDVICDKYEIWIAHYLAVGDGSYDGTYDYTTYGPTYASQYGMYQFTDSVWINGYGPYDGDVCYKDYPSIVKTYGFNGYEAPATEQTYLDKCTYYPSHVQIKVVEATGLYSEPRSAKDTNTSVLLEEVAVDTTYTTLGIYQNTGGNIWYQVKTSSGELGYIYSGRVEYVKKVYSDIKLKNYDVPNGHVEGDVFYVTGTISSTYNTLNEARVYIYSGFGTEGDPVTGGKASVSNNSYTLDNSAIDNATSFGDLPVGTYTYVISATYESYRHDTTETVTKVTGTRTLKTAYFTVVESAVDQSTCSHKNTETVLVEPTATTTGTSVTSCSICGLTTKNTLDKVTSYIDKCTFYPSHVMIEVVEASGLYSEPRSAKDTNTSVKLEDVAVGTTLTTLGIYQNTGNNIWYQVKTSTGELGYIYSGRVDYVKKAYEDIKLTDCTVPNGHVEGDVFYVTGTISSTYNTLNKAQVYVYSGFGTDGDKVTGGSASVSNNTYTLNNSDIDNATSFNSLPAGNYTYVITADYESYRHDTTETVKKVTGTRTLKKVYFVVVESAVDQATCSHKNTETILQAATCTETGTSVTACSICGLTTKNTVAKTSHPYGSYTVTKEATCTEAGSKSKTCTVCGKVYTKEIPATGHSYTASGTKPTCTKDGVLTYTCACGDSYTEKTAATGHSYSAVVTKPTCTAGGYTTYTCSNCGDSYTGDKTSSTGHSYSAVVTKPTCTAGGYTTYTCPNCGDSYTGNKTAAAGHKYEDGTCTVCGAADPNYVKPVEKFDIAMTSMTMGNSLAMNIAFEQAEVSDWTGHYAVITKTYADGRENVVETVALADWKSANIGGVAHYYVTFNGISAKEMTDDINVVIYNANDEAVSNVYTDSVAAQSARILAKSTTSDAEKTMIVDMLNYGAAAQEYFGYGTDNLANSSLTNAQKAYASEAKTCTDIRVKGTNYVATNVVLKSNIQMMFAFQNIDTTMTAKVTFTNHRGVAKEVTINGSDFTKNGSFYVVTVDALVVADGRQAVTCVIYDANGNQVANATDSLESYTARKNGTEDIFVKMMQYSDSAYAYFH